MNYTGHELCKCAEVTGHTNNFVFQWFNSCHRSFLFHLCICCLQCNILLNLNVVLVLCCICKFYLLAMSGFNAMLVNVWFLLSSLVCLGWVVFNDHFITKSCYYQTKICSGLVICVLAISLFTFSRAENFFFFSHTYFSLHSSINILVCQKKIMIIL